MNAASMDEKDVLKKYKEEFYLPDYLYYEANGLGPMSRRSEATLNRVAEEWKNLLVAGWFAGEVPWFYYPERIAAMEEELVGAKEKELIINGTTTTNIQRAGGLLQALGETDEDSVRQPDIFLRQICCGGADQTEGTGS